MSTPKIGHWFDTTEPKTLWTLKQSSILLNIEVQTIHRWIKEAVTKGETVNTQHSILHFLKKCVLNEKYAYFLQGTFIFDIITSDLKKKLFISKMPTSLVKYQII